MLCSCRLCSSSLLVISPRLLCHLHLMEFFTWTVSWLKTAYRRGNSIHPWGMPRFRVTGCKHDTQGTFHVDQSHPFTMAKVSETGLWSFRLPVLTCFCSGMGSVVLDLRQEGMIASVRLRLKSSLNTSASWSAHASSPNAFQFLTTHSALLAFLLFGLSSRWFGSNWAVCLVPVLKWAKNMVKVLSLRVICCCSAAYFYLCEPPSICFPRSSLTHGHTGQKCTHK